MNNHHMTLIENGVLKKLCDECVVGFMIAITPKDTKTILPSSYVKKMDGIRRYLHECDTCGCLDYYDMEYPSSMFLKRYL